MKTFILITLILSGCGLHSDFASTINPTPIPTPLVVVGPQGPTGQNGVTPIVTMSIATLDQCSNGGTILTVNSQDTIVCNGVNGTNTTPITIVQLCQSCTPSYPSVFPEVVLCINGGLTGVYSQNGGFLSDLPNGAYTSDGINCSCNFTITGCSITY